MKRIGIVREQSFYSEALQEEMTLLIYSPRNFSPFLHYNLLIAQDGLDYFRFGRIARQVETLMEEDMKQLIIIGIPYTNVDDRKEKYHPDGHKFKKYMNFLTNELVPYLDNQFPALKGKSEYTLIGDSLAATVSLMAGLLQPAVFTKLILQSPYVNEVVLQAVENFTSSSSPVIYHQIGDKETEVKMMDGCVKDFLTPNRELNKLLTQKGFSSFYEEFKGEHLWKYWQASLTPIFRAMFN
ncbi:alpha/beta hydrolase-fold protein [Metabacillus fastidiosus]